MGKFYPPPDLVAVGTARAPLWIWGAGIGLRWVREAWEVRRPGQGVVKARGRSPPREGSGGSGHWSGRESEAPAAPAPEAGRASPTRSGPERREVRGGVQGKREGGRGGQGNRGRAGVCIPLAGSTEEGVLSEAL